ncbi:hypothetical protein LCGC14_2258550, partial [marine sediment metagenome]
MPAPADALANMAADGDEIDAPANDLDVPS